MEQKYEPLTKIVTDKKRGIEFVTCRYYGTETCHNIHKSDEGCSSCRMFAAILNQLHSFETERMSAPEIVEVLDE